MPIRQSLGRLDRRRAGRAFAQNIIAEHTSNPRMLIVHEVMGRNCGWLTAATAEAYHDWLAEQECVPGIGNARAAGTCTRSSCPSATSTWTPRPTRLHAVMDELGCVNIFLSEGAGVDESSPRWRPPARRCPATRSAT